MNERDSSLFDAPDYPDSSVGPASASKNEEGSGDAQATFLDREAAKRAIDELFHATKRYQSSEGYNQLMEYIIHFRAYSPFNALLIHIQKPGAVFVAPPDRWARLYGRAIKPGARPLVILRPMGPVMFVFDVADTVGEPLPPEVESPFKPRAGRVGRELERTIENAMRDGVRTHYAALGSQAAGSLTDVRKSVHEWFFFRDAKVPVRYELEVNEDFSPTEQYATITHELAHLYCGHLGTPNPRWWPDRPNVDDKVQEFEAESVTYLLCKRLGIENPTESYLSDYVEGHAETPNISLESVLKAAGLIESMGKLRLAARKEKGR